MKKTVSILLLLALCLTLVGCGGGSSASTEEPSVLTVALAGQPEHLDVGMSTMDIASEVVYGSVYEKLVAFRDAYAPIDGSVDRYLRDWLVDFVVYYGLDPALAREKIVTERC